MKGLFSQFLLVAISLLAMPDLSASSSNTKHFQFNVEWKSVRRLCHRKAILTVNGKFPGPTIAVNEGDNVQVKVTNSVDRNTTIHWHGVRQLRTGWADGPAYITQCPIGTGKTYTYNFTVVDQRGTLWWHAHFSWQRASVYGAFIIYPSTPFPFPYQPEADIPIILGEWWNGDVEAVESEMMLHGGGPNTSDAYTINGLPGPSYPCSDKALSSRMLLLYFPKIALLLFSSNLECKIDFEPYLTSIFPFDNSTTIGFVKYQTTKSSNFQKQDLPTPPYTLPDNLPSLKDTPFVTQFLDNLKSLGSKAYPCKVPRTIDKRIITTISLNLQECPINQTCKGLLNKHFYASMNNQSFIRPRVSLLESHYYNLKPGLSLNFPENPPYIFNYTGVDPMSENMSTEFETKILEIPFGTKLEIVLQDTNFLNPENHPIHIHGHNFFIVGRGFGNFDVSKDPLGYNLEDPPERNTVAVPVGGWAAIRLITDNPGVWFVHCHLEEHISWGLALGFLVRSGKELSQSLLPPPGDLPPC
ncbi:Multicopper oxidase [Handroanthus impetiginosus]|uniref:Multicopper oxidase n=1 Tax=Handroanthus impetiginosus TaxID=429701 RepID=A0A2G9H0H9_9LAMI|nr:Multicopper oxidase [Handroanthus impetiginosus]